MNFKKIKPDYYITIKAPMRMKHDLKGTDLLIYAIIFGFSQEEGSWFTGSISYLMEWTGVSKKTVITSLKNLVERGLIIRDERTTQNGTFPIYKASATFDEGVEITPSGEKITPSGEKITPPGEKTTPTGGVEITPNKDILDKDNEYINNNPPYNPPNKVQKVFDLFNEICVSLPKVRDRTDGRIKAVNKLLADYPIEVIEEVFAKAEESDFISGRDGKWGNAGFDWLMKVSNFVKVKEGNYKNKQGRQQESIFERVARL